MEEKENTIYGSPGNSVTESLPTPINNSVTQVPNRALMNLSGEATFGLATNATIPTPNSGSGTPGSFDLMGKKKRGRPRKYDSDGNLRLGYGGKPSSLQQQQPGLYLSPGSSNEFSSKRGRGRPPGSGNWKILASLGEVFANTAGGDFIAHVVTVNTGEDVAGKIISFAQKGPRGICILSANGTVSNVTIRQPGSSGGILTYEGRFEILSLTGSFTASDGSGIRNRTGGLSVSLAGPDGRVIGGGIAGLLTAAGPIQIVVGSFMLNGGYKTHKRKHYRERTVGSPTPTAPFLAPGASDMVTAATPISQLKPDGEMCTITASQLTATVNIEAENDAINKRNTNATSNFVGWNGLESEANHGPSPDINVSAPGE